MKHEAGRVHDRMRRLGVALTLLALTLLTTACDNDEKPTRKRETPATSTSALGASSPGITNGRIAFASDRDQRSGVFAVYLMNPDGSGVARLTGRVGTDPVWSPDGRKILFLSIEERRGVLYIINSDGTGETRLVRGADLRADWSPDGAKVVISRLDEGQRQTDSVVNTDLYVINSDATNETRLTTGADGDIVPAWSSDGAKIAFLRLGVDGTSNLYVVNPDGTGIIKLAEAQVGTAPAWASDGSRIAFHSKTDGLSVINKDGSGLRRLLRPPPTGVGGDRPSRTGRPDAGELSWSPDGMKIAYESEGAIHIVSADGSGDPFPTGVAGGRPIWSPDGRKILFHRFPAPLEIYVMNPDGSGVTNLSNNPAQDVHPSWQRPAGRTAAG